jgi:hypothetical protein
VNEPRTLWAKQFALPTTLLDRPRATSPCTNGFLRQVCCDCFERPEAATALMPVPLSAAISTVRWRLRRPSQHGPWLPSMGGAAKSKIRVQACWAFVSVHFPFPAFECAEPITRKRLQARQGPWWKLFHAGMAFPGSSIAPRRIPSTAVLYAAHRPWPITTGSSGCPLLDHNENVQPIVRPPRFMSSRTASNLSSSSRVNPGGSGTLRLRRMVALNPQ